MGAAGAAPPAPLPHNLERERLELERERLAKDVGLREKELALREREITLRELDQRSNHPLSIAIFAAALAVVGNIIVTFLQGKANRTLAAQTSNFNRELEREKAQANLILEAIKTGDTNKAAENLNFFIGAGLINDPQSAIRNWVRDKQAPSLPAPLASAFGLVQMQLEVVDTITGSPIPEARVACSPLYFHSFSHLGLTDESGKLITQCPPGRYLLRVQKDGYTEWSKEISVPPDTDHVARLSPQ
jgi:hypothetical protein